MATTLIKSGDDFYKLSGVDEALFDEYNVSEGLIEYNPNTLLDDNMAYKISRFSTKEYCIDILKNTFNDPDYNEYSNTLNKEFLLNIVDNVYYFQRITPAMLRPKRILRISNNLSKQSISFEQTKKGETITLQTQPDAIYDKDKDELRFIKLNAIKRFFVGIDTLYREATNDEIKKFLNQDFIQVGKNFSFDLVMGNNRKKIALLKDKYSNCSNDEKSVLRKYIHNYDSHLAFDGNVFEISSNKELTNLLRGLDEDYYTKPIENQKYVANSSIKFNS
ncbi:hypothetical protein [Pediococcus pentosaceus]|uniref:hypothetical protein n=1 Tax=Pediococcus pentosaceus TaxID=1255 RepID=UPI000258B0B7|nr:hypothetical protein [Pediococcus pentosaceus]CCG91071.1 putative uncharacterized protein [Pediococcus pentosaceus IE-3]